MQIIDSADLAAATGGRNMFPELSQKEKDCIDRQGSIIGDTAAKCLRTPHSELELDAMRNYWYWAHPGTSG